MNGKIQLDMRPTLVVITWWDERGDGTSYTGDGKTIGEAKESLLQKLNAVYSRCLNDLLQVRDG